MLQHLKQKYVNFQIIEFRIEKWRDFTRKHYIEMISCKAHPMDSYNMLFLITLNRAITLINYQCIIKYAQKFIHNLIKSAIHIFY